MKLFHNIAHQVHIVASSGAVMTDGARHPFIDRLVDHGYWEQPLLSLIDIRMVQHGAVTVKSVHDNILVVLFIIITDNRHGITVCFDAFIKQRHLRRRHRIGIIRIGFYLSYRNRNHLISRAFILHSSCPPHFCIFFVFHPYISAAVWSCRIP